jgi:hypothetical protein
MANAAASRSATAGRKKAIGSEGLGASERYAGPGPWALAADADFMTIRELAHRHLDSALQKERQKVDGTALGQNDELVSVGQRLDGLERPYERLRGWKAPEVEDFRHRSPAVF